ncbi:hypothetical protein FN846DRAFT_948843 [Sphaerosporella brunnea]|uniref:Uncharacterized protein n=1 Tax=Sphaerosporella brunnea TaxID=1250544 RepID=A0A5J5EWW9_9PEZI|nr:hypothetical protein FN846DRAFT_948843 [Sphaerosporella brunnea]
MLSSSSSSSLQPNASPIPRITVQPPTPSPDVALRPNSAEASPSTVYHIYTTGAAQQNWVLHTTPDRELRTLRPGAKIVDPSTRCCCSKKKKKQLTQQPKRDEIVLDDPDSDPRQPSYYMHTPRICGKSPPQTIRLGGKGDGVVCLFKSTFFWRRWKIDFVVPEKKERWWRRNRKPAKEKECALEEKSVRIDSGFAEADQEPSTTTATTTTAPQTEVGNYTSLNAPGVVDGRGVVAAHYPLRSFGLLGETGRNYVRQQSRNKKEKEPIPSSSSSPSKPIYPAHLTPSQSQLVMHWNGWWTREYCFRYGDIEFRWRGTSTVSDERKFWGRWSRFNHLKLIACLPIDDASSAVSSAHLAKGKREVEVVKYTSIWAKRKVGRLELMEAALEECCPNDAIERERLRHVVVSTALCMISGEKQKRQTIREIILTLISAGQDGATSGG